MNHELTAPLSSPVPPSLTRGTLLKALDSCGGTISFACAIHCLALPFIITFLPFLGLTFLAHSTFEVVMICLSLALATSSFCLGTRVHGRRRTFLFIAAAAALFFLGHEADPTFHWILIGIGGLALCAGHYLNYRLCQTCTDCH